MHFLPFRLSSPKDEFISDRSSHPVATAIAYMLLLALFATANYTHAGNESAKETNKRDQFSVEAMRYGDAVQVHVRTTVKAPFALIWNTLTDYDHLSQFVPGMKKSLQLERHGKTVIVEQSGYAHLWFLRFPIDATVEVTEYPPSSIQVRLLKGNLKRLEGHYEIEKLAADQYALRWSGTIEPGVAVPGFLATDLMRKNISEQFLGVVQEIERRAALVVPVLPMEQETPLR